jgi:hypothetical protein
MRRVLEAITGRTDQQTERERPGVGNAALDAVPKYAMDLYARLPHSPRRARASAGISMSG